MEPTQHLEWTRFGPLFTIFWHGVDLLEEVKRLVTMDLIALYFRRQVRLSDEYECRETKEKFAKGLLIPRYTRPIHMNFIGGYHDMLEQMVTHLSQCTSRVMTWTKYNVKYLLVHYIKQIISNEEEWRSLLSHVPVDTILNVTIIWEHTRHVLVPFDSPILELYNRK